MTTASDAIIALLSYSATDIHVSAFDESEIIRIIRGDANVGATLYALEQRGFLSKLFSRVDSGRNNRLLCESVAGGLAHSAYPLALARVANLTSHRLLFERCFYLQSAARRVGLSITPRTLADYDIRKALRALTPSNITPTSPFGGSGATGVDPKSLSIGIVDQGRLAMRQPAAVAQYSNPIPGSLSAYLSGLTPDARMAQGKVVMLRKIVSIYPSSYLSELPSRADVMRAAGRLNDLEPALIAAFVLAEQRDQSTNEDAKDYIGATSMANANTSIGLGQVVVTTAQNNGLFDDLLRAGASQAMSQTDTAAHLTSDEFNIFGVAKYIRIVANRAQRFTAASLPNTHANFPGINFSAFKSNSTLWPDDNIRALASEYTSRAWDDRVSTGWGDFVYESYRDIKRAKVF